MTDYLAGVRMTDYLAAARDHAAAIKGATFGSPAYLAHMTAITAFASLAVAEALPQGTEHVAGETTGIGAPSPSPAEPALVALDRAEQQAQVLAALTDFLFTDWREFDTDEWNRALDRLRLKGRAFVGLDEIGGAA